jgi:hypothetical protein
LAGGVRATRRDFMSFGARRFSPFQPRPNYRAERGFAALYEWLAKHGISAWKKLHELRKECGAVIANSMGILAASQARRGTRVIARKSEIVLRRCGHRFQHP